jgi:uncharacterized protein (DUF433 family)
MERRAESVIVQDPEVLSGEPVFRGTRVPFQALLDYLEGGDTLGQFLEQFPGVSRADAVAALEEAKALVLARFLK